MASQTIIATVGEILVEFVSYKTNCALEKVADYSGPYPSGAPAIFLDQAALMGSKTEIVGGVGADGFGRSVLRRLREDSVGVKGVYVSEAFTTGVAFVSYYDNGERDFIFHLSGTAADAFEVPTTIFDPAKTVLHVSASSLGVIEMRSKIMATIRMILDAGGRITCDPNARPELMRDAGAREAMYEVMERSYCLLPSTSDLSFLFPDLTEDEAIDHLFGFHAEVIALKRGASGCTIIGYDQRYDFKGHDVQELDPTGAGDCFGGTFISLLTQGLSLYEAGRLANAAGAIAVTRRGPMEGNSTPSEISAFLNNKHLEERSEWTLSTN